MTIRRSRDARLCGSCLSVTLITDSGCIDRRGRPSHGSPAFVDVVRFGAAYDLDEAARSTQLTSPCIAQLDSLHADYFIGPYRAVR